MGYGGLALVRHRSDVAYPKGSAQECGEDPEATRITKEREHVGHMADSVRVREGVVDFMELGGFDCAHQIFVSS